MKLWLYCRIQKTDLGRSFLVSFLHLKHVVSRLLDILSNHRFFPVFIFFGHIFIIPHSVNPIFLAILPVLHSTFYDSRFRLDKLYGI